MHELKFENSAAAQLNVSCSGEGCAAANPANVSCTRTYSYVYEPLLPSPHQTTSTTSKYSLHSYFHERELIIAKIKRVKDFIENHRYVVPHT